MDISEWVKKHQCFLEGYFSSIPEDAPDGAWFQMHVDGIEWLINTPEGREVLRDSDMEMPDLREDSHDIVLEYLSAIAAEQ